MRILSGIKRLVVPPGRASRRILSGPFRGLRMEMDLRYMTQLYLGLFERETYPWLWRFAKGIRTAVDIGAAQGEFTLFFLARTQASKVLSFEPGEGERRFLGVNLQLNGLENDTRLSLSPDFVGASPACGMVSLDSLLPLIQGPCFIKLDVDGAEMEVLRGAMTLMREREVRWLVETHTLELEKECLQLLGGAGFETRVVPNAWWRCVLPEMRVSSHSSDHNRWLVAWRREGSPVA
jgi:hypothetical protein